MVSIAEFPTISRGTDSWMGTWAISHYKTN